MAYNPTMYQTYGNMYGNPYAQNPYGQSGMIAFPQQQQQSYQGNQQAASGIIWVDGEVGAKAFQMPTGWPVNTPLPLWDTNDTIIYLKSTNQMGMPNPLQRIYYKMEELEPKHMGVDIQRIESGSSHEQARDMSEYVKKDELDAMKEELKAAIMTANQNQNNETRGAKTNAKSSV